MTVKGHPVLTAKRKQVYDYIKGFIETSHSSPTLQEIGNAAGLTSLDSVHKHLTALEQMKLITRVRGAMRSIQLKDVCPACGRRMPKGKAKGAAA